jgi:hypothetical protein
MRLNEKLLQTLAFLKLYPSKNVGFYKGPLTWMRQRKHKKLNRKYHITIIGREHYRHDFAPLTVYSINEHCTTISANLNEVTEKTDAIWFLLQDPIKETERAEFETKCKTVWKDKRILNSPETYNIYHSEKCFPLLDAAGVSVPRYSFSEDEVGKTKVIYKKINQQASEKFISEYKGHIDSFRPFEFIDTIADGVYHRFRAFFAFGAVIPSIFTHSPSWNVGYLQESFREVGFDLSDFEVEQLKLISKTLKMDYFAVDFIRANNTSYFIDVNIYPTIQHRLFEEKKPYGLFHTFNFLTNYKGTKAWEAVEKELLKGLKIAKK